MSCMNCISKKLLNSPCHFSTGRKSLPGICGEKKALWWRHYKDRLFTCYIKFVYKFWFMEIYVICFKMVETSRFCEKPKLIFTVTSNLRTLESSCCAAGLLSILICLWGEELRWDPKSHGRPQLYKRYQHLSLRKKLRMWSIIMWPLPGVLGSTISFAELAILLNTCSLNLFISPCTMTFVKKWRYGKFQ